MTVRSRLAILASMIALTLVLTAGVGWWRTDEMRVEVRIVGVRDEQGLARPNVLNVEIVNSGPLPIQPVFAVRWDTYPYRWTGPRVTIRPGESLRAELRTRILAAMPPPTRQLSMDPLQRHTVHTVESVPFVVQVNHAGNGRVWQSQPQIAFLPDSPIANGRFETWALQEVGGSWPRIPASWAPTLEGDSVGDVQIVEPDSGGVELGVRQDPSGVETSTRAWKEAGLGQEVSSLRCPVLRIATSELPEFQAIDGGWPVLAAGLQVVSTSRPDGVLWLVLSRIASRRYVLPSGTIIWQLRIDDRGEAVIDLREAAQELGAAATDRLDERLLVVKVFLAAERRSVGEHRFAVRSVDCEGGT